MFTRYIGKANSGMPAHIGGTARTMTPRNAPSLRRSDRPNRAI